MKLTYTDLMQWERLSETLRPDLRLFLSEWFDDSGFVTGHTSGSTGTPKTIRLNKADMRASARMTDSFFGIDADSVLLLSLSADYIAGKMMVVRALEAKASLWVGPVSSRPLSELDALPGSVDLAALVPMQVEAILRTEREKLNALSALIVGGAPLPSALERRLADFPVRSYATYGMTETVSHVALRRLNAEDAFSALGKVTFSCDDRGCLVIDAPHLSAGRFITNDAVKLLDNRHFQWLGRQDHVINSGGLKFFPEMIERRIEPFLSVNFYISSLPDDRLGERIVLVLEDRPLSEEEEKHLLDRLGSVLSRYELPKQILCIPAFERTSSGKVLRRCR